MRKKWFLLKADPQKVISLTSQLGISTTLAELLLNRGIEDIMEAEKFLFKSLYDLPDPYELKDMEKTVERIRKAIQDREAIMLLGDYDLDGLTALALLWEFLNLNSAFTFWYLPHRIKEGYGISRNAIEFAKEKKISLFVSLDCGTTACEEVKALKNAGIDVLIVDHHKPRDNCYPPADGIVNPHQLECSYPEKELTSVGLTFKILQAFLGLHSSSLLDFLDLVCLGTVADVASLRGENRILVKYGLESLRETKRVGLKELFKVSGLKSQNIDLKDISYIIAPRLNARGRVGSAEDAFRLLLSRSPAEAEELAQKLESSNRERQKIEAQILKQAYLRVEQEVDFSQQKVILIAGEDWHPGVLGIVASRLADEYFRPCIVLSESDGILRGSGRSIPEFNILEAVSQCREMLEEFGGHRGACGIKLRMERLDDLKEGLNRYADGAYTIQAFSPKLRIDKEIDFDGINSDLLRDIQMLSPFGPENPEPLFLTRKVRVDSEPISLRRRFCKFWVKRRNFKYPAFLRNKLGEEKLVSQDEELDIVYIPTPDEWEGIRSIKLFLEDVRKI